MNATVAIVSLSDERHRSEMLAEQLSGRGVGAVICPERDVRGAVRWAVDLSPDSASLCVVIGSEPGAVAPVVAAVDAEVRKVVWALDHAQAPRLAIVLAQTPALVSFADSAEVAAEAIAGVLSARAGGVENQGAGEFSEKIIEAQPERNRAIEPAKVTDVSADPPPKADFDEDAAMFQQLEKMMAVARTVTFDQPEPVPVQPKALDFSVSLRELMTQARVVAQSQKAQEVLPVHYLAGVAEQENVYRDALAKAGIDREAIARTLGSLRGEEAQTDEPVISDAVFDTVSLAKAHARQQGADCVRVYDFLTALFEKPTPAVEALLREVDGTADGVLNGLREIEPMNESVDQPFFKPSSRDQAGFYEFNEVQVQDVASRLERLPAFQKAAKPVKAKRERREAAPIADDAPKPVAATSSQGAPPAPDEPELFRVNGDFPSVDVVEQTADLLLEGHLVAFPSDVMRAVAADATNSQAVAALRRAAGVPDNKPLGVLINSTAQLKYLARADLDSLEPLFDFAWPGPLTLVFDAAPGVGGQVTYEASLAVRQPADSISLAILSMLGRPLAVTSWDDDPAELTGKVAAVIRSGEEPVAVRTTVVDVRKTPWQVLRKGAVPAEDVLKFQP